MEGKKIVYNACFGGFGLSALAVKRYAELCGRECYFFAHQVRDGETDLDNFEEVSVHEADGRFMFYAYDTREALDWLRAERKWKHWSLDQRKAHNEKCNQHSLESGRGLNRDDPRLVQVVEELGAKASGRHGELKIREIPKGTRWRIDEYDGRESVMTVEDYEWETA